MPESLSPETIIHLGGVTLLLIVVFAETGLFFGFFLPGDSLLFTAGLFCHTNFIKLPIATLIVLLIIAATLGTATGYLFGKWFGNYFSHRKENFFYRKKYVDLTQEYFQKYGMMAFVFGRFIPIVRTFLPILAGIAQIDIKKFWLYNTLGATFWVFSVVMAGYWLSYLFPNLTDHLGLIIIVMILVSTTPVILSVISKRIAQRKG
ncbi:MAG: DedA protein [Cytophagales bacterium]|jgi:membrane-associated protein|nr:VTT domain-containing protein [Bacteroidota bacterium]MBS1982450.1 VTT domain-containing protein [Bacteroidota bacterium]WHZ06283.1 MAG: DedA protein [Cytophagales bacterium]